MKLNKAAKVASSLTEESKVVFARHFEDSLNWSGSPILDITKEQRGNLTDLKKKGLLTTWIDDGHHQKNEFVNFTPLAVEVAREFGLCEYAIAEVESTL